MFEEFKSIRSNDKYLDHEIMIRNANELDINEIATMNATNDLSDNLDSYIEKYEREFFEGKTYICVAEYQEEVVGYGRTVYAENIEYPYDSIPGWYLMGLVVKKKYRQKGIGKKLTVHRIKKIIINNEPVYCLANLKNRVSIDLHLKLGFKIIDEKPGFLTVKFSEGKGYLMKYSIENLKR